jgi:hypothetical protein
MYAFSLAEGAAAGEDLTSYPSLHRWSISHPEDFWRLWLGRSGIATLGSDDPVHDGGPFHRRKWFPHLRLSAAANLMRGSTEEDRADEEALVAFSEDGSVRRITWSGLFDHVMALREELAPLLAPGDRVAAVLPNGVEAVIAMLASVSLGAVWSSASPDFGVDAILDRFRQIDPVVFFGCRGYSYGGKWFDAEDRMETVRSELPSLRAGYVPFEVPRDRDRGGQTSPCDRQRSLDALPKFAFDHPMYTMFSSGTTAWGGRPVACEAKRCRYLTYSARQKSGCSWHSICPDKSAPRDANIERSAVALLHVQTMPGASRCDCPRAYCAAEGQPRWHLRPGCGMHIQHSQRASTRAYPQRRWHQDGY